MASSSRKRETASANTGNDAHFLSDVIRTADIDFMNIEKRTKFIKAQLDNMSEDQLTRFEFFVRSHLSRGKVKDILSAAVPSKYTITDDMAIVVGSLAKLFVGELVETSMEVLGERERESESNAPSDEASSGGQGLLAQHLREGYRRMQCEGKIGLSSGSPYPFSKKRFLQVTDESDSILMGAPSPASSSSASSSSSSSSSSSASSSSSSSAASSASAIVD